MAALRPLLVLAVLASSLLGTGCQLLHELKPHRLSRWNRGPDLGRDTSNFSVDDTTATEAGRTERLDALLGDPFDAKARREDAKVATKTAAECL